VVIASFTLISLSSMVEASGKKPTPISPAPITPPMNIPQPYRYAVVQPVKATPFNLPNGTPIDLSLFLPGFVASAVDATPFLRTGDLPVQDPCNSHLEVRSEVTSFQMDISDINLSFGFTPGGQIGPISNINGKVGLKIGSISMHMGIYECKDGNCFSVESALASHATAGVSLSMEIDFSMIKTGPSFVYNTPVGSTLQKILTTGMAQIGASQKLSALPWSSIVRDYNNSNGTIIFDAGWSDGIANNQVFEIYAPSDASVTGVCNAYRTVAIAHTVRVDNVSSVAQIDQFLDSRGIQVGDVVKIGRPSLQ
jgi:hypothetical protein